MDQVATVKKSKTHATWLHKAKMKKKNLSHVNTYSTTWNVLCLSTPLHSLSVVFNICIISVYINFELKSARDTTFSGSSKKWKPYGKFHNAKWEEMEHMGRQSLTWTISYSIDHIELFHGDKITTNLTIWSSEI